VDFVLFGDLEDENEKKLQAFHDAVKSGEGSHLEVITPGPQLLSDRLVSTPILLGDNAPVGSSSMDGGPAMDLSYDANEDPELALALRMSLEEENARQEKARREEAAAAAKADLAPVKEEEAESEPLLDQQGQPNSSGGGKRDDGKDGKAHDSDKMDTS